MIIENINQIYDIVGNEIMLSNLSIDQIAKKAGVTAYMVGAIKHGRSKVVTFENIILICKALEIEIQINIKK